MSRPDKRNFDPNKDDSNIRLFAFSNALGGYKPMHHAPQPIIVLRTKVKAGEHPAKMWKPLAESTMERNPQTYAVYVLDCSPLGEAGELDERTTRNKEGPLLRRISNLIAKLAPEGAVLVAVGSTCELAVKLLMYSGPWRNHFSGLVLAMCNSKAIADVTDFTSKHMIPIDESAEPFSIDIFTSLLGSSESIETFTEAFAPCKSMVNVAVHPSSISTLFGDIAAVLVPTAASPDQRGAVARGKLDCYQSCFILSRHTKQSEQDVHYSPVEDPPGTHAPVKEERHVGKPHIATAPIAAKPAPPAAGAPDLLLFPDYVHTKNACVKISGRVVDSYTIATVHGQVRFDARVPELRDSLPGDTVSVEALIVRNDEGQTLLGASTIRLIECKGRSGFFAPQRLEVVPKMLISKICHFFGAALIRGRKVALARSLEGVWKGMRIPHRPHCAATETPFECASTALCNQCGDISPDNFYLHHAIAPAVFYPSPNCVVTLYVAVAVQEGTTGPATDAFEILEDLNDTYDWYTLEWATQRVRTPQERTALEEIARNVGRAADAGMYTPLAGYGVFGRATATAPDASVASSSSTVSSSSKPLLLIQDPIASLDLAEAAKGLALDNKDGIVSYDPSTFGASIKAYDNALLPFVPVVVPHDISLASVATEIPSLLSSAGVEGVRATKVAVMIGASSQALLEKDGELLIHNRGASRALVDALPYADVVALSNSKSVVAQQVAALAKLFSDDVSIIETVDLKNSLDMASASTKVVPIANPDAPSLFVVTLEEQLPFHPSQLNALLAKTPALGAADGSWGLLHVAGHGWLATEPIHKVTLRLGEGGLLRLHKSDPWWCCVEDDCVPEEEDKSTWHPEFGSRTQSLMFVVNARPGTSHESIASALLAPLREALCPADTSRGWSRLEDPFTSL